MKFIISTDAGSDLDLDYIGKNNVNLLSMKYYLNDGSGETEYAFGNGEDGLSIKEFYQKMRDGATTKTALINEEEHKEHFNKIFENGGKHILHIPLSSGLSGTAEFAQKAAAELNAANPDKKIIVVDFKGASMGQGLFVDYLVTLRDNGKSLEEAANWAENNKLRFCHYFTVDDLVYLKRGGRVSGFKAFVGTLLKIKPLLHVDDNGKLIPVGKSKGRKKAVADLTEKIAGLIDTNDQRVFISHADSLEDAELLKNAITEKLGIVDFKIGYIGPIIGAHSGPGTLALFFTGKNR